MRFLFAHAHPDDETLASGALIAHLIDQGHQIYVLTATRGEMGDVVEGPLAHLSGTPELAIHREAELAGALAELGVTGSGWLGEPDRQYRDSGMVWLRPGVAGPCDSMDERALSVAPIEQVAADIVTYARGVGTEVIVSYDSDGGYGHPDHIRMHDASVLAARQLGVPFQALVYEPGGGVEWFELPAYEGKVLAALRCYPSQLQVDGTDVVHCGGQREAVVSRLGLKSLIDS